MAQDTDFERLVNLYYPPLYRFAFSLTRQESDACDLTQQTFLIWARKGHQLNDANKVKSWLFTTLHREYLQQRRKMARFSDLEFSESESELPEIPPVPPGRFDGPAVLQAVSRLEPSFQAPIALFYLEDYSYQEIAEILEIPLGTVKSRISRGIAQLQNLLLAGEPRLAGKDCRG
jgi:RNA polymerase sigma-70 factor (ECF subfamily)